jgi:hypothetical protein
MIRHLQKDPKLRKCTMEDWTHGRLEQRDGPLLDQCVSGQEQNYPSPAQLLDLSA